MTKSKQTKKPTTKKSTAKKSKSTKKQQTFIGATVIVWVLVIIFMLVVGLKSNSVVKESVVRAEYDVEHVGDYVTLIGDSISYMSEDEIKKALPGVDIEAVSGIKFVGTRGRFGIGGFERLKNHAMRDVVVFMLGSNGGMTTKDIDDLYEYVGTNRKLILMTNYVGTELQNSKTWNATIMRFAQKYDNVSVMDWYIVNVSDPSIYLIADKLHPNEDGKKYFAQLIRQSVLQALDLSE